MPLEKKLVREKLLEKFNFEIIPGTKHERLGFYFNGKMIANTGFSRNTEKVISDDLLKYIAEEVGVFTLGFFKKMINCTKNKEEYINELKSTGLIKNQN